MQTIDQNTAENFMQIAQLRARIDGHDEDIARHERHLTKLDDAVATLREGLARVATKDDIIDLRTDISQTYAEQMRDAHNSIPVKFTAWVTAGMFVIAAVTLFLGMHHG